MKNFLPKSIMKQKNSVRLLSTIFLLSTYYLFTLSILKPEFVDMKNTLLQHYFKLRTEMIKIYTHQNESLLNSDNNEKDKQLRNRKL